MMLVEVPHNAKTFQCNTLIDQRNYFKFVMTITDYRVFQISFKENRNLPPQWVILMEVFLEVKFFTG